MRFYFILHNRSWSISGDLNSGVYCFIARDVLGELISDIENKFKYSNFLIDIKLIESRRFYEFINN